jgi:transketolase
LRKAFVDTLCQLACDDPRIMLLTGDLGYMALEPFRERFPQRFLNAGVAEQNMIGVATGLADAGFRPYAYSIAPFASLRPFEFIRNGPVVHKLPVRIVGMGAGFEYGYSGRTHYGLEDIGVLRTLPGLTLVIPADSAQAAAAIRETRDLPGPVYYSLGKDDTISVPGLNGRFELGKAQVVREGRDIALVAMGSICQEAVIGAGKLAGYGIEATVVVVSSFHPDPEDDLAHILAPFRHAISVEAQTVSGSLGALVATVIATRGLACCLHVLGVRTASDGTSGVQMERWRKYGLDGDSILAAALCAVRQGL